MNNRKLTEKEIRKVNIKKDLELHKKLDNLRFQKEKEENKN